MSIETDRFSVTMKKDEIEEIKEYTQATGVQRNELVRRATLAYLRIQSGKTKEKDITKVFRDVGSIEREEPRK